MGFFHNLSCFTAADADVSMDTAEDGSETRSLRRRSAAASNSGTPTSVGGKLSQQRTVHEVFFFEEH